MYNIIIFLKLFYFNIAKFKLLLFPPLFAEVHNTVRIHFNTICCFLYNHEIQSRWIGQKSKVKKLFKDAILVKVSLSNSTSAKFQ